MEGGEVSLSLPPEENVLWIDPLHDPRQPVPAGELRLRDSRGERTLPLESAVAENGEIVWFARLNPAEPGRYEITASRPATELLAQDRWDPVLTARGKEKVVGVLREGTELFVRFAPSDEPPVLRAVVESHRGKIVNLVRNGGFEEEFPAPAARLERHPSPQRRSRLARVERRQPG